jgi:hypothetical protein
MAIPATNAIRETVILGFQVAAETVGESMGLPTGFIEVTDEEVGRDFDQWLAHERGLAYQRALDDVQAAISEASPIVPGRTVLDIVNPYYDEVYGTTDGV